MSPLDTVLAIAEKMEAQKAEIAQLKETISNKEFAISCLDDRVDGLLKCIETRKDEIKEKDKLIEHLNKTVRYMGEQKDLLREHNIKQGKALAWSVLALITTCIVLSANLLGLF